jgi:hypothetical protein
MRPDIHAEIPRGRRENIYKTLRRTGVTIVAMKK